MRGPRGLPQASDRPASRSVSLLLGLKAEQAHTRLLRLHPLSGISEQSLEVHVWFIRGTRLLRTKTIFSRELPQHVVPERLPLADTDFPT